MFDGDLSWVRGFNYTPARSSDDLWFLVNYDAATVDRDLGFAGKLNLNQVRVFLPYDAWRLNKTVFREHLIEFIRACRGHGIGAMLVLFPNQHLVDELPEEESQSLLNEWIADLVDTIGKEPGLTFWDVANEPDWEGDPEHRTAPDVIRRRMDLARWTARRMHELDKKTPVTVGCTHVPCMEELSDSTDILSYHDYSPTAAAIQTNIKEAKSFAARIGKPVLTTEIGCVGRANPYDIALQEYDSAHMGWYIWELMVTSYWGDVHGVFYGDGTVRDPSIVAAILGFYRNRSAKIVPENPDREGWVTRSVEEGKRWLGDPGADWGQGLDIAEIEANLIEAAQIGSMRELPTRAVRLLRSGKPDDGALHDLIRRFTTILEPYEKK
jgi:hypothetical protein